MYVSCVGVLDSLLLCLVAVLFSDISEIPFMPMKA